jgi:hypothetical protein
MLAGGSIGGDTGDMRNHLLVCAIALAPVLAHADKTFIGTAQGAWDCAKEPSVHIMRGEGSYVFKGACRIVTIEGGDNRLTIEAVDNLRIVGGSNVVDVGTLGAASIIGADNKLTWKAARAGDRPKISAIGADNQISQAQ